MSMKRILTLPIEQLIETKHISSPIIYKFARRIAKESMMSIRKILSNIAYDQSEIYDELHKVQEWLIANKLILKN